MEWANSSSEDRLRSWREHRDQLCENTDTDLESKLKKTAKYWADAPIGSRTLDFYTATDWEGPWEILHHGSFCKHSISLMIYYTLQLSLPDEDNTEIYLIDDGIDRFLVPVVNKSYVLNYILGEVVDINTQDFKVIDIFDFGNIKQYI